MIKRKLNVQLLTQAEAHKRWPKRGYDTYDPIEYVIAGSRRNVLAAMGLFVYLDGKYIPVVRKLKAKLIDEMCFNPDLDAYALSIDMDKPDDYRLVIFK